MGGDRCGGCRAKIFGLVINSGFDNVWTFFFFFFSCSVSMLKEIVLCRFVCLFEFISGQTSGRDSMLNFKTLHVLR